MPAGYTPAAALQLAGTGSFRGKDEPPLTPRRPPAAPVPEEPTHLHRALHAGAHRPGAAEVQAGSVQGARRRRSGEDSWISEEAAYFGLDLSTPRDLDGNPTFVSVSMSCRTLRLPHEKHRRAGAEAQSSKPRSSARRPAR